MDRQPNANEDHIDGPYAWFRLSVSILLATIGCVGMWAIVVVLPAVQAEFAVDRADASIPYTFLMVGFAVGNMLIGRLVDRMNIALPMIVASVALGGGFVLAGLAADIWLFAAAHGVLIGIGTAATFGPLIADVSHWFEKRRGVAVAAAASGNYLAGAIWPNIMQVYLQSDGWRATYIGIGIFCIVTMVPLSLLLRRASPRREMSATSAGAPAGPVAISRPGLSPAALQSLLIVAGIACCVAMSMPQVHIVAYCVDLGFGLARGAEMLSLMLVGGIISRLASGFLADRIGGVPTLLISSVLQGLSLLLYLPFDGLVSLYMVSFAFGLAQGGIVPSYAIVVREYLPAREAGQRVGIVITATIAGMALGGWLSGYIYDLTGSYQAAFLNGIAWNLLNVAVMLVVLYRTRGGRPAPAFS